MQYLLSIQVFPTFSSPTITASNEGGSVSTTVTITVTNAGCTGLTGANVVHNGHFEEECPEGYEGTASSAIF